MPDSLVLPLPPDTRARVVAVIRAQQLDEVMAALQQLGVRDVLVQQVRGYGRQKGHLEFYAEGDHQGGFLPKVRLEFVVAGPDVPEVVESLRVAARTGRIGDGKLFVHPIAPLEPEA
jgi:nitrogen regulatory protein PII